MELFGNPKSRRGWVSATTAPTIGEEALKFDPNTYPTLLPHSEPRPNLPFHSEIDALRPKSPPRRGRGGQLPHNPHPHPHAHKPQHQPYSVRPPRHQYQQQYQNPAQMHQMQMQAQAQAQMAMQMQMQHMQMMAAMNMNMNMGMGMPDPMTQGMGMGMDPAMMGMNSGQEQFQGQEQSWGYMQGGDGMMHRPQQGWGGGQMGSEGGGMQQGWQGNPYDSQNGQYQSPGQVGQWQGGQFYPGQGQWGWQQ